MPPVPVVYRVDHQKSAFKKGCGAVARVEYHYLSRSSNKKVFPVEVRLLIEFQIDY